MAAASELSENRMEDMKEKEAFDRVVEDKSADATFVIHVQHRQHSSWQGEITWMDKGKKEYFRSVWELVKLMNSVFDQEGAK